MQLQKGYSHITLHFGAIFTACLFHSLFTGVSVCSSDFFCALALRLSIANIVVVVVVAVAIAIASLLPSAQFKADFYLNWTSSAVWASTILQTPEIAPETPPLRLYRSRATLFFRRRYQCQSMLPIANFVAVQVSAAAHCCLVTMSIVIRAFNMPCMQATCNFDVETCLYVPEHPHRTVYVAFGVRFNWWIREPEQ